MQNFIAAGRVLDYTNGTGSAITSGSPVVIGAVVGVAVTSIAIGAVGAVNMEGAYQLASVGFAGAQGQRVYWDTVALNVTGTASANTAFIGTLYSSCLIGDTTCVVNLIGAEEPGQAIYLANSVAVGSPTTAEFNALLVALRNAGLMARS